MKLIIAARITSSLVAPQSYDFHLTHASIRRSAIAPTFAKSQ